MVKMIARKRRGKAEVYISIKTVILIMITILILIVITITTITTALKILTWPTATSMPACCPSRAPACWWSLDLDKSTSDQAVSNFVIKKSISSIKIWQNLVWSLWLTDLILWLSRMKSLIQRYAGSALYSSYMKAFLYQWKWKRSVFILHCWPLRNLNREERK